MTQIESVETVSHAGKWKPYPAYKDSGVEWLGEIPIHWEVERLKFNSYIKGRIGWQNLRSDEFTDTGPYLITGMHFNQGSIDWDACYHITEERYEMAPEIQVKEHDVLITKDGSIGKVAYIEYLPGKASLNSHLLVIRPLGGRYVPRYLYYLLLSSVFRSYILLNQAGSTFFGISQESVVNFLMMLPTLEEQDAVAVFLNSETTKISTLIAKKERLIELLQEKRAALISHAVTKGLDPTVPMKDSGVEWLGEIPAYWEVKRLKFVADVLNGVTKGRDLGQREVVELPYLRVANVQDGYLDLSDIAMIIVGVDEVERYSLQRGDVLMNEGGDFDKLGRGYVWDGAITPCLHQNHVFAVRPHLGVDSYWISIITLTSYAKHYFILKSKQSTNLASISGTNLKELPVLMPPEDERNAILNYIKVTTAKIDTLISRIREDIEKLKEYSAALISAAVTGKIDVRETIADYSEDR